MQRTRIITLAVAVPVVIAIASAPASAATYPRLVGHWKVNGVVTSQSHSVDPVGEKFVSPYTLKPTCSTGGCVTTAGRKRNSDATVVHTRLTPSTSNSVTTYKGTAHYVGDCYDKKKSVLVHNGYNYSETTVIRVTKVSGAGVVTAFTGKLHLTFAVTAAGEGHCRNGYINDALTSGVRTS